MKIFISHSSQDTKIVTMLVELLYHIGINENNIFCSSVPELSIPEGENIFDYLAELFQKEEIYVIFILSDNYYNSVICLNEMGAAWVTKSEYTSILLPNFEYNKIEGAIDPMKVSIKLDTQLAPKHLNDLKEKFQSIFRIDNTISNNRWNRYCDEFITKARNEYLKELNIDLSLCRAFCINDQISYGCVINQTTLSKNLVSINLDFSKTKQDLCSLVIYPEINNWRTMAEHNKCLQFEAVSSDILNIILEIKFKDTKYQLRKKFCIDKSYNTYQIILNEYGEKIDKWSNVTEICFLIEKKNCIRPVNLTIKLLKIK